jgi:shikimate dehydrogenase
MTRHRVGIIGWPVEHSLSPRMHNAAFAALGLTDWMYDAMAIPPDILAHGIREPQRHGYIGLNVTIPHKTAVMAYVQPDAIAREAGAVNTIDFRTGTGTNTDVAGFIADLVEGGMMPAAGDPVLVIGAGGAARAALVGLAKVGLRLGVYNRDRARANALGDALRRSGGVAGLRVLDADDIPSWSPSLVVNCTPVGMAQHADETPWPATVPVPSGVAAYDMVYRLGETRFLQTFRASGGAVRGGVGMLVQQGALAFRLWTGLEAPVDVMRAAVLEGLQERDAGEG